MEEIQCLHCGGFFPPSPRHKTQSYCAKPECRRARKAAWQRDKMKIDADYRLNQRSSQKQWAKGNPGYWKRYRKRNPEKAERNRMLQTIRNRRRSRQGRADPSGKASLIAKMDASKWGHFELLGQFWMVPVIAKMDALKVSILRIPTLYP